MAASYDGGLSFADFLSPAQPAVNHDASGSWDDCQIIAPGVVKVPGNSPAYYMVYEGNSVDAARGPGDIGMATSTDGLNWQKSSDRILTHLSSDPSANNPNWEHDNIGTPGVSYFDGKFYVFYHGDQCVIYGCAGERRNRVGFASGSSLTSLTRNLGNPVMDVGVGNYSWESHVVSRATVFREGKYYYMFFEGSSSSNAGCGGGNWGWGIARSTDLKSWDRFWGNPIRQRYQAANCGQDLPYVFPYNGNLYVYQREPGRRSRLTLGPDPNLYIWQAESDLSHQIGRLDTARQISGEAVGWSASTGSDSAGYLTFGPYTTQLPTGKYSVNWRLLIDDDSYSPLEGPVLTADINDATNSKSLSSVDISRNDFQGRYSYQFFERQFAGTLGTSFEFRVNWKAKAYIKQDYIIARLLIGE